MSPDNDSPVNRQLPGSWPSLVVVILAAWGFMATAPRLISQRPKDGATNVPVERGAENLPARLWQDPLEVAYDAAKIEREKKELPKYREFGAILTAATAKESAKNKLQVCYLGVCLPGNRYPEGDRKSVV